jgi:hypothetical protein
MKNQKPKLDLTNINIGFVIAGLAGMVEDDGLTPHEAFEMLDLIKSQTFFALSEIKNERANKKA